MKTGVFWGGMLGQTLPKTLDGPGLGSPGNFKMCRGNARSPNTVGVVCKFAKVVPQLIDTGANILASRRNFCDTSRVTEATSTRKTL